jgi:hypothetical protein
MEGSEWAGKLMGNLVDVFSNSFITLICILMIFLILKLIKMIIRIGVYFSMFLVKRERKERMSTSFISLCPTILYVSISHPLDHTAVTLFSTQGPTY